MGQTRPKFLPADEWVLTNAGFEGPIIKPLSDPPLTFHAFVKVGEWGDHEIVRHLYCAPHLKEGSLMFAYADFEDDHFFDFENLQGDKELFNQLQEESFNTWEREANAAVRYTDGHIDRAARLFADQILNNSASLPVSHDIKVLIKKACKECRFDYVDVIALNGSDDEE